MIKLAIFDHDGLMVNSELVVYRALSDIFKQHNHDFTWEYFTEHIGMSVHESLRLFYKDFPLGISFDEFYSLRNSVVSNYLEKDLQLMPGLISLLKTIKRLGIKIAISTSGKRDYIKKNLAKFGIGDYFGTIVCIEDVIRGKPYPDLVLKCLEKTQIQAEHAIMFEDAPHGIEAANKAGVFSIAIPTKGMNLNKFKHAKLIVPDLKTINALFTSLKIP